MLSLLTDLTLPIRANAIDSLMTNVVQLNQLDAGLNERQQKALDILFDIYEIKAKTAGATDFTNDHPALIQAATSFSRDPLVTRHGDLRAAHLAIAFNNAQKALARANMPALTCDVNLLLAEVRDFVTFPPRTEDRMGLFLSYLRKH